jgi:hypothetical protein
MAKKEIKKIKNMNKIGDQTNIHDNVGKKSSFAIIKIDSSTKINKTNPKIISLSP